MRQLIYAIQPEQVPTRARHSQVLFPNGKVSLQRLEAELKGTSGITVGFAAAWLEGNNCVIAFKDELPDAQVALVDAVVRVHSGQPVEALAPRTGDGRPLVALTKPDASKKTIISHDWTDPTTWYTSSVRVAEVQATDTGDHCTYSLPNQNLIDLCHGKVFGEDFVRDREGHTYRVLVTVNSVQKTERDAHLGAGGDFEVDYAAGRITFFASLQPSDVVQATYHYATDSLFVVRPEPGKALKIAAVEVQFATDVVLTDSVVFQPMGFVDAFAPQLVAIGAVPSGTKIPLGEPLVYKSFTDFQSEAVRAYPKFPAIGGNNWRATPTEVLVLNWDYVTETALRSDLGLEVHIKLQHDAPFEGWYATATFYCSSEDL